MILDLLNFLGGIAEFVDDIRFTASLVRKHTGRHDVAELRSVRELPPLVRERS